MSDGAYAHRPMTATKSVPPRVAEAPSNRPKADPHGFAKLTGKKLRKADAPRVIQLPPPIAQGLQSSWNRSQQSGKENGGNIVRTRDNSYGWRQGQEGTEGGFAADPDDVGKDQTLVGAGHTHPYTDRETMSFSADDLSSLVSGDERLEVMQSEKTVFIVARTAEFDALVDAAYDKDLEPGLTDLKARIEASYNVIYSQATKATMERFAELATVQVCKEFKLAYYRGAGSTLARVE